MDTVPHRIDLIWYLKSCTEVLKNHRGVIRVKKQSSQKALFFGTILIIPESGTVVKNFNVSLLIQGTSQLKILKKMETSEVCNLVHQT